MIAAQLRPPRPAPSARLLTALAATAIGLLVVLTGCSDLTDRADATVTIDAQDRAHALRLRQELLDQSSSWGGVRVGERTTERDGDASLTFSLPGRNLDAALGSIRRLDGELDSTRIDVDRSEIDRNAPSTSAPAGTRSDADDGEITLRVDVQSSTPAGAGAFVRLVMSLFSVVGMVATVMWIGNAWRRRFPRERPPQRRRVIDLGGDPPTEQTPTVPRDPRNPWN